MNLKAELRIYGVECYFTQPNASEGDYSFKDYDNEEIANLSDIDFIESAENNGYVWSLYGFLRDIEAHNFGARATVTRENMQFRAYLIDIEDESVEPIRIDEDQLLMRVADIGYSL